MRFYKEKVAYFRQNPPLHQTPFGAAFEAGRLEREKENDALRRHVNQLLEENAKLKAELEAFPLLEDAPGPAELADHLDPPWSKP